MTEILLSSEDILSAATVIYEGLDTTGKEVLRSLIDTYYSKVQHDLSGRVLFTESDSFCPVCLGVRLLKKEREISITSSTLDKDYKCPVCKRWYSASEVTGTSIRKEFEPIQIWSAETVPEIFKPILPSGWLMIVPPLVETIPLSGDCYHVLPDGRIGMIIDSGAFEVLEGSPLVPDLFGHTIYICDQLP